MQPANSATLTLSNGASGSVSKDSSKSYTATIKDAFGNDATGSFSLNGDASGITLLKAGKDIKTDTIRKAIKAAHSSQKIIIAMDNRPTQLDTLYDPMLKVVEVSGVDLSKVNEEITELKSHLS